MKYAISRMARVHTLVLIMVLVTGAASIVHCCWGRLVFHMSLCNFQP